MNRLDSEDVSNVLVAAGHQRSSPTRTAWPAGLSDREVEVLLAVARMELACFFALRAAARTPSLA